MSFWRKDVIQPALDAETARHIEEQRAWIAAEPANPRPCHNLAQLYRLQGRQQEALGLLLEAVRLDAAFAPAHVSLAEIYAVLGDLDAARRHAAAAAAHGDDRARRMLDRYPPTSPSAGL